MTNNPTQCRLIHDHMKVRRVLLAENALARKPDGNPLLNALRVGYGGNGFQHCTCIICGLQKTWNYGNFMAADRGRISF